MLSVGNCHCRPWKCRANAITIKSPFTSSSPWINTVPAPSNRTLRSFKLEISASASSKTRICEEEAQQLSLADRLRPGGLAPDGFSYKENFTIRCYEVGVNRTATIEAVANLLQEVACNHAQSVGFSTDGFATTPTMRKRHLIWVAARMHIEVYKYPAWGDVTEIETWCQSEGKIGTRRDWILKDATTDNIIGRATSTWVMMNQDTRRLYRVTDDVRDEYMVHCPKSLRLAFPEENNNSSKKIPKLEDPAQHSRSGLMPRRADLDMNQHVNNVTYIGWVLESMPQEVLDTHELEMITLDYRRECNKDDIVESLTSLLSEKSDSSAVESSTFASNGNATSTNGVATTRSPGRLSSSSRGFEFLHMLRLAESGFEINRGRTEWRRKPAR
uniref:Acyl-[acyl-carrier-protein] hydrolase n=1 Tax=Picea sitchensis TaxID=3332 RepID=B8LS31_PICSI|nr:unknown [Picea sitchensis]